MRDTTDFKDRFQRWKGGTPINELYDCGKALKKCDTGLSTEDEDNPWIPKGTKIATLNSEPVSAKPRTTYIGDGNLPKATEPKYIEPINPQTGRPYTVYEKDLPLSGTDPVGEAVIEGIALDGALRGLGWLGKTAYSQAFPYLNSLYKAYRLAKTINKAVEENPIITGYNRNPAFKDIGGLWNYQNYLERVFPNTKIKDVLWHGSREKDLQKFSIKSIGSNAPIKGSVGMYLTPNKFVARSYGKNGDVYPVLLNSETPYVTHQFFALPKNGVNVARISPKTRNTILASNDAVIAPERSEIAFFNPDNALILGSNSDMFGFSRFTRKTIPDLNPNEVFLKIANDQTPYANGKIISDKDLVDAWSRIYNTLSLDKNVPREIIDLFNKEDLYKTAKSGVEKFVLPDPTNPQYVIKKFRGASGPEYALMKLRNQAVLNEFKDLILPSEYIGSQKIGEGLYVPYFRQRLIKSLDGRDAALAGKNYIDLQKSGYGAFNTWLDIAKQNPEYSVVDGRVLTKFGSIGDVGPQSNIGIDTNGLPIAFDPMLFDADNAAILDRLYGPILYDKGKSIHIKPANRGKLTALKKRTGKSEAELYNDGNPAHKKMVVFARNARHWKH